MNALAEFTVFASRSGQPSALHVPTGVLLHSRVNPLMEAQEIAVTLAARDANATVIVGGGLGYLAEAVLNATGAEHSVVVIEPHAELVQLARTSRRDCAYAISSRVRVITAATHTMLATKLSGFATNAMVMVAPYLLRLAERKDFPLSGLMSIVRTELASGSVYNPLLNGCGERATDRLRDLPSALSARLPEHRMTIVVGAGPSLNACTGDLVEHRAQITILAASGAVPALKAARIIPDYVFALEAKSTIVNDLTDLPLGTKVVVFPATHPAILSSCRFTLMTGANRHGESLETRGGSSIIPAVDFALRAGDGDVALVGMDLSNHSGAYATGSLRNDSGENPGNALSPKFLSMREGIERVLRDRLDGRRTVFHVLADGNPLKGTQRIGPEGLSVVQNQRLHCEVRCD